MRDMARTLELEAQSQLDKGYPNAALSTLQGRPLAALLPELEEALGEVLEAAAKLCPSDKETKPADGPSAIASKPKLDIAKLGTYYNDLVEALLQAAPGASHCPGQPAGDLQCGRISLTPHPENACGQL